MAGTARSRPCGPWSCTGRRTGVDDHDHREPLLSGHPNLGLKPVIPCRERVRHEAIVQASGAPPKQFQEAGYIEGATMYHDWVPVNIAASGILVIELMMLLGGRCELNISHFCRKDYIGTDALWISISD